MKCVEDIFKIVYEVFYVVNFGCKGFVVIDFLKDMGVLVINVDLCDEINILGYEVVIELENKDIDIFILFLKEVKKFVVLVGVGIN